MSRDIVRDERNKFVGVVVDKSYMKDVNDCMHEVVQVSGVVEIPLQVPIWVLTDLIKMYPDFTDCNSLINLVLLNETVRKFERKNKKRRKK